MYKDVHGGDLYSIAKKFGIKEEEILDFSSNINPLGLSEQLKELLHANIDRLINYPDPECNELREELSQFIGVHKNNILAGNGASEMIYLLFETLRPHKILMPAPCFAEYARAACLSGSEVEYYELKEEYGFRLDMKDFLKYIKGGIDTVILCNPNNPTSVLIPRTELLELLEYAQTRDVIIIIDEAFIELTVGGNENSIAQFLGSFSNLYVLRALTKILAIPGLRLGYILGNSHTIDEMVKRKVPWSVNSLACSIGKVLNSDTQYFSATSAWLREEMEYFYRELSNIKKLKVFKPEANFILLKLLDESLTSGILLKRLIKESILIRDASGFKYLNDKFIRIAIKDRKANEKLISALKVT